MSLDANDILRMEDGAAKLRGMFDGAKPSFDPRFQLLPFSEIKLSTTPDYLVKGIIPQTGLVVVWGAPKCGKTFWCFDVAMHVALGWRYRGRRVKQGSVVYLALEGGHGFIRRKAAWQRRHLPDDIDEPVPFYLVGANLNLTADANRLVQAIRAQSQAPAMVVIDTLNRALVGDENSSDDMARFIQAADVIRTAFDCAVIIIHHCGTQGSRPRGHTSLTGAADAQFAVERDGDGNVVVRIEFMKDGEASATMVSRLDSIDLGLDDDGDPITSCIIVPVDGEATTERSKLPGAAKTAFELLRQAIVDDRDDAPASNHIPPNTRTTSLDLWRRYCDERMIAKSDKPDARRKAFVRAVERLQEAGNIGIWNNRVWITGHAGH